MNVKFFKPLFSFLAAALGMLGDACFWGVVDLHGSRAFIYALGYYRVVHAT